MSAHRYWRLTGFLTDSNVLELSQAQLYDGTTALTESPSFTVNPTTGTAFPDTLHWDDVSMPGFALTWNLATPVTDPRLRLGAGSSAANFPKEFVCQYSDDGLLWSTNDSPTNVRFPGAGLLTPEPGTEVSVISPAAMFTGSRKGFWFDPSDMSSLFQDTAGTTPVTATGQSVRKMLDKSGRGAHCYARASAAPTLQVETDGRYYIDTSNGSALSTDAIDLTYTSNITVFVGVQVLATPMGVMLEVSPNVNTNEGSVYLITSEAAAGDFSLGNRGSYATPGVGGHSIPFATPSLSVLTARYDIAGTTMATEVRLRRNEVDSALTLVTGARSDSGTGNYGNHPVYISSRANTSLFSNVRIYSLVLLGDEATALEIETYEAFTNSKTNAYTPSGGSSTIPFIPLAISTAAKRWRITGLTGASIAGAFEQPFTLSEIYPHSVFFDAYHGGSGNIVGTVKEKNTPANTPLRRRVLLIDEASRMTIRETWSDPVTGAFEFRGIKQGVKYSTISYDHLHNYRAVIADNQDAT